MSGPKRIKSRRNIRTQVRSKHGGARPNSGPKKTPKVHQDMRALLIERLQITIEKPKELGKHWMDYLVIHIRDPQIRATPYGAKLMYETFKLIFLKSQNTPRRSPRFARDDAGDESEDPPLSGETGLPPLAPDPAKVIPLKPKVKQ